MPLQNRVLPTGQIIAHPARGTCMGNRGILHDSQQQLGRARWRHKAWIICHLQFKGRHRQVMAPNRYTELFFLDEATALAAGHRPCAECRRADYNEFRTALSMPNAPTLDAALHRSRTAKRAAPSHAVTALPAGCFILHQGQPALIGHSGLHRYSPAGYGPAEPFPDGPQIVLTPQLTCQALRNGYRPEIHESATHP